MISELRRVTYQLFVHSLLHLLLVLRDEIPKCKVQFPIIYMTLISLTKEMIELYIGINHILDCIRIKKNDKFCRMQIHTFLFFSDVLNNKTKFFF